MSNAQPRSATTVALLADIPSTGHVGEAEARRFPLHGDGPGARSSAFVTFAIDQVRAGRKVIALYPAWRAEDAQRAINFARGALRTDRIAGISVDLSPLALSLIADQLAYLAPYLPPGMIAALSRELPKHLLAGAWLRTVSNLSTLPTSMRQHVGSYAPSVSFLAFCAPSAQVGRLRPDELASRLPFRPVRPVQLLYSTPDSVTTRTFDDNLPRVIQPVATRRLPAQPLGNTYWGTGKYVEFVALSAHPQALAYAAGSIKTSTCAWCGEPMAARPCPFCSANTAGRTTYVPPAPPAHSPGPAPSLHRESRQGPAPRPRPGPVSGEVPEPKPPRTGAPPSDPSPTGAPVPGPPPHEAARPHPTHPQATPARRSPSPHPEPRTYSR